MSEGFKFNVADVKRRQTPAESIIDAYTKQSPITEQPHIKSEYDGCACISENNPHTMRNALLHRDGIDGICALVTWRQDGVTGGWWVPRP